MGIVFSFGQDAASADLAVMTISEDTTLTEDFVGVIVIEANGVTLDCDGRTVEGGWQDDYGGVRLAETTGVTVKNCVIQEFFDALVISGGSDNHIVSNSIYDSDHPMLIAGDSNVVEGNIVAGGVGTAVEVNGSSNTIRDNQVAGIHEASGGRMELSTGLNLVSGSSDNVIVDNTVTGVSSNGLDVSQPDWDVSGNVVSGNTFSDNGGFGIVDTSSWLLNTYVSNTCIRNGDGPSSPEWLCDPDRDGPFIDEDGHVFENAIEWLSWKGITRGCNPPDNTLFCPDDLVTRGQMAAFLVRALNLTEPLDNPFTDDDDSIFEADIERLAAAGLTKGCNPSEGNAKFCPDGKVTREQMAAFLVRALRYTDDGGGDLFNDDDDSIFEGDIDRLGTAGVTKGCNPPTNDRYCPSGNVTRGQMAAFLHRALR